VQKRVKQPVLTKHIVLPAILFFSIVSCAQTQPINVTIEASRTGAPISKFIYGQFLEHIGGRITCGFDIRYSCFHCFSSVRLALLLTCDRFLDSVAGNRILHGFVRVSVLVRLQVG
jgi:hypothetical protein